MRTLIKENLPKLTICLLLGAAAGLVNGFLGAGGGLILLWLFGKMNPRRDHIAVRNNFASVVATVLLLSTVSAVSYSHNNDLDTSQLLPLALPGVLGGIVGAHLTDKLDTAVLKLIFSLLLIIAGINMIR